MKDEATTIKPDRIASWIQWKYQSTPSEDIVASLRALPETAAETIVDVAAMTLGRMIFPEPVFNYKYLEVLAADVKLGDPKIFGEAIFGKLYLYGHEDEDTEEVDYSYLICAPDSLYWALVAVTACVTSEADNRKARQNIFDNTQLWLNDNGYKIAHLSRGEMGMQDLPYSCSAEMGKDFSEWVHEYKKG